MPSVESITSDIQTLGTAGQEKILNYLEEVIVLGSYATEVTNEGLRVVLVVRQKREKEVYPKNKFA